jgi:hypothetical protein
MFKRRKRTAHKPVVVPPQRTAPCGHSYDGAQKLREWTQRVRSEGVYSFCDRRCSTCGRTWMEEDNFVWDPRED